jgi:hypothetical protein
VTLQLVPFCLVGAVAVTPDVRTRNALVSTACPHMASRPVEADVDLLQQRSTSL